MSEDVTLACPWCGSQPVIEPWHGGGPKKHAVHCEGDDCEAGPMVTGETKRLAIAAWNRRPPVPGWLEAKEACAKVAHQFDGARTTNKEVLVYAIRQRTAIAEAIRALTPPGVRGEKKD